MGSSEEKELPLFSPINLLIAAAAIVVFVVVFIIFGNRIFTPGDLSASYVYDNTVSEYLSHADFEGQCKLCHQPLRGQQAELCVECHQNVGSQVSYESGFHGLMSDAVKCRNCHPEHEGREFDQIQYANQNFNHTATNFPLQGQHANIACIDCHPQESIGVSSECASCHAEPALHAGIFSSDCSQCHETETWRPATWQDQPFDHELVGFSLSLHQTDYSGDPISCQDCHTQFLESTSGFAYACQTCHLRQDTVFIVEHVLSFGETCTDCHDGVDRMMSFDHESVFPIGGKHLGLDCMDCHTNQQFNDSQTICATCHQEPEVHASFFGQRCQMCHQDLGWQPALLASHDFPLNHGNQGDLSCDTCHNGAYMEYTCYNCHDHKESEIQTVHSAAGIASEHIPDCIACHLDGLIHEQP